MASWSQTFSVNNKYSLTLTCTEQSYSVANNTSEVAYSLVMATAANSYTGYADYRTTISVSINGTSVYSYNAARDFNPTAKSSYSETLCSGTVTVGHNTDGTKSCACAASVTVASGDYSPGSASISQSLTLTTIPRASTASWSGNFVIGSQKVITITRASSSFTHKLVFSLGSQSQTAPSGSTYATTSYTWTPSAATWAAQLPTQTSRTGTLTLTTYNGSTVIGSNTYTFTLEIPSSWVPTVSVTLSPVSSNTFVSGTGEYVQGYSSIRAAITGTATTGATIRSYTISGAFSKTVTTSASSTTQTSGVIASSGSKTVSVKITDSRGKTATVSASCTYRAYTYPAITAAAYNRGTYSGGTWTQSDSGEDLCITFTGSCSLSGYGNEMSWSIGAPVSASGSALASGSSITEYATGIGTVTAYNVTITVTDAVGNSSTRTVYVPTLEIPFVLDPNLPAVGVGAVPQTARTLELASNWMLKTGAGIVFEDTTDVLASALAQPSGTIKAYRAVAGYSGTLPDSNFASGTFLVNRRYTTSISVIAFPATASYGIAINTSTNGSTWAGWQQMAIMTTGSWTPTLYDLNTLKVTLPAQTYHKIGALYFCKFSVSNMASYAATYSTMLQIRGLPCTNSLMGQIYIAQLSGSGGDRTFQSTNANTAYPRPNITGTINSGYFTGMIIGV